MFFFEQRPCVHSSFISSGAYLRSSHKDQPKWVTDVGLVRLLSEDEHQMGPADGSQWEAREAEAKEITREESYLATSARAASCRLVESTDSRERSVFGQSQRWHFCCHCSPSGAWRYHPSFLWMDQKYSVTLRITETG